MNSTHRILLPVLFCFWMINSSFAQESVLTAGGSATGNEGMATYSIGQVAFHSVSGSEGIITEGVQQPFEVLLIPGINDETGIVLECTVSPNPAEWYVKLSIENHLIQNMSYQLCDLKGSLLQNQKIKVNITTIALDHLSQGTYILNILEKDQSLKKFKIIKK